MGERIDVKTRYPGITKRGNRYSVRVRDADGRMHRFSASTVAEALQIQGQQKAAAAAGRRGKKPKSAQTFYEYAVALFEDYDGKTHGARDMTVQEYKDLIERFVKGTPLGKRSISSVEIRHVKAWIKPLERQYSPSYVRRMLTPLRAVFRAAIEDHLLETDPSSTISTKTPKPNPDERTLTAEQIELLVKYVPKGRDQLIVRLMAFTGIRISEMVGFDQRDFAKDSTGAWYVQVRQRVRNGDKAPPKSERSKRTIPLPDDLAADIERYVAGLPWRAPEAPLFQTMRGGRMNERNWRSRVFNEAREKAAAKAKDQESKDMLARATPHMLRHSAARRWRKSGIDMGVISKLLGHDDPSFTQRVYGGVLREDIPSADLLA